MEGSHQPFVSVVTPVYNEANYLAECIESVLAQTYQNYEYLIVNNCSTDKTLEVAMRYAERDSRIRVCDNTTFLAVIANHNHAFSQISPEAKYCKVVSGDDFIFPDCLRQLVECAEANPSAGFVGSYQQSGRRVRWQGFKYPASVIAGRDLCRSILQSNDQDFGFGTPTSLLYRADLIRRSPEFYPNASPHADTSACFKELKDCDFGFVYQVLSFERVHEETQSTRSGQWNRYSSANLSDILVYGPHYLSDVECKGLVKSYLRTYHRFLAIRYFSRSQSKEFWAYHESRLKELGYPLKFTQMLVAGIRLIAEEIGNPKLASSKLSRRLSGKEA